MQTITREHYIPRQCVPVSFLDSDAVVYIGEQSGRFVSVGFHGAHITPDYKRKFMLESDMKSYIEAWSKCILSNQLTKDSNGTMTIEPGSILYYSWGINEISSDFLQVIECADGKVLLRKVGKKHVSTGYNNESFVPIKGCFVGTNQRRKIGKYGAIMDYGIAVPWDGRPKATWFT